MTSGQHYQLERLQLSSVTPDALQLATTLDARDGDFHRLDNRKMIAGRELPLLVRAKDGGLIKIRCFKDEDSARVYVDLLGSGVWPHTTEILGRYGRAVAEAWSEGEFVFLAGSDHDRMRQAGAALGSLHASPHGIDLGLARGETLHDWIETTSNRIERLSDKGLLARELALRLFKIIDDYAPEAIECGLSHGDFAPDHLLVDARGKLLSIDNETVRIGALDFDLVRTWLRWPMRRPERLAFLEGYSRHRNPEPAGRCLPFWLVAAGVAAVEWASEHTEVGPPHARIMRCLHYAAGTDWSRGAVRAHQSSSGREKLAFHFFGARIDVASDDVGLIAWLEEFLAPHFATSLDQATDRLANWSVECRASEADFGVLEAVSSPEPGPCVPAFMRDEGWISTRACGRRDGRHIFFDDQHNVFYGVDAGERRVRIYSRLECPLARAAAMRVVRELAMRQVWRSGALVMHAAALARDGKACLITGPKGAGKTTLLTYLMQARAGSYVTNDRAALARQGEGYWIGGIPTIVSVRAGTTDLFPVLKEGQMRHAYRQLQTLAEARATPVLDPPPEHVIHRPNLSPAQYRALLGCDVEEGAYLSAILIPAIRTDIRGLPPGGFRISRLPVAASRFEVENGLLGSGDGWPGGEMIAPAIQDLAAIEQRRRGLMEDVAVTVPCLRVEVHRVAFESDELAAAIAHACDEPESVSFAT